jgi:hypothetical protein
MPSSLSSSTTRTSAGAQELSAPFPSSTFLDKNRRNIGDSPSRQAAQTMETARSPHHLHELAHRLAGQTEPQRPAGPAALHLLNRATRNSRRYVRKTQPTQPIGSGAGRKKKEGGEGGGDRPTHRVCSASTTASRSAPGRAPRILAFSCPISAPVGPAPRTRRPVKAGMTMNGDTALSAIQL